MPEGEGPRGSERGASSDFGMGLLTPVKATGDMSLIRETPLHGPLVLGGGRFRRASPRSL